MQCSPCRSYRSKKSKKRSAYAPRRGDDKKSTEGKLTKHPRRFRLGKLLTLKPRISKLEKLTSKRTRKIPNLNLNRSIKRDEDIKTFKFEPKIKTSRISRIRTRRIKENTHNKKQPKSARADKSEKECAHRHQWDERQKGPSSVAKILRIKSRQLTDYEQSEILSYQKIYFVGEKKLQNPRNSPFEKQQRLR